MCRVPRVLLVAPEPMHTDLRRQLSSLEYEITAAVTTPSEADGITADVAVAWEPTTADVEALRASGYKVVAVAQDHVAADMVLAPDAVAGFKTRFWELFRAR